MCACVQRFAAQKGRPRGDLPALIHELGLQQGVLNQAWSELSVSTTMVTCLSNCVDTLVKFLSPGRRGPEGTAGYHLSSKASDCTA